MDEQLVTLGCFNWLVQADLALGLGGIRLQVSPDDVEDARAVLQEEPQPSEEPILTFGWAGTLGARERRNIVSALMLIVLIGAAYGILLQLGRLL